MILTYNLMKCKMPWAYKMQRAFSFQTIIQIFELNALLDSIDNRWSNVSIRNLDCEIWLFILKYLSQALSLEFHNFNAAPDNRDILVLKLWLFFFSFVTWNAIHCTCQKHLPFIGLDKIEWILPQTPEWVFGPKCDGWTPSVYGRYDSKIIPLSWTTPNWMKKIYRFIWWFWKSSPQWRYHLFEFVFYNYHLIDLVLKVFSFN